MQDEQELFTCKPSLLPYVNYLWLTFALLMFSSVHLYLFKIVVLLSKMLLMLHVRQVLHVSGWWVQNWNECITLCMNFSKKTTLSSIVFVSLLDLCRGNRILICTSGYPGTDCLNEASIQLRGRHTCLCLLSAGMSQYTQLAHLFYVVEIVHTIFLMCIQYYWSACLFLYVC